MDMCQQDSDGKCPVTVFKGEVKARCRGVTPTEACDLFLKFSGLRDGLVNIANGFKRERRGRRSIVMSSLYRVQVLCHAPERSLFFYAMKIATRSVVRKIR